MRVFDGTKEDIYKLYNYINEKRYFLGNIKINRKVYIKIINNNIVFIILL